MSFLLEKSSLIVSCQAPSTSPLHHPQIIAAIAQACVQGGAAALRLDTPAHIQGVKSILPTITLIGLWKQSYPSSSIYITPTTKEIQGLLATDAEIIAIDATLRQHPEVTVAEKIQLIHQGGKLVMADVDSVESGLTAAALGADIVATTLYGYTEATQNFSPPAFSLLPELTSQLSIPVICEGGIATPEMAKKAIALGAYSVVVGTAITGIDQKVQDFASQLMKRS